MNEYSKKNYSNNFKKSNRKKLFTYTLKVFLPVFVISLTVAILYLNSQYKLELATTKSTEINNVNTRLKNIQEELNHSINNLFTLISSQQMEKLLNDFNNTKLREEFSEDILNMMKFQSIYDQGRLIDKDGNEIIRVNFNKGSLEIISKNELQNKKHRYYFYDTFKLEKNEIFISPLDLNVENGKIEQPFKPMIRIGTPVFDDKNNKKGIFILNFLANHILTQLDDPSSIDHKNQLMLINSDGYWLKCNDADCEWGFMFEEKKELKFSSQHPEAWKTIKETLSSQLENESGLYTFRTIFPLNKSQNNLTYSTDKDVDVSLADNSSDYHWKIISFIPHETLFSKHNERKTFIILLLSILLISFLLISINLAKTQISRNEALASLKTANLTKDKFISIISHDLRGPFGALLGITELIEEDMKEESNPEVKNYFNVINPTIKNLFNLLENLLEWSKTQRDGINFNPESIMLHDFVKEIINLLSLQIEKKNIIINYSVPENLEIFADKNMISTIFRNLISNAIKFTPTSGSISISAIQEDSTIKCFIEDTGVGIPENKIETLFSIEKVKSTLGTEQEEGTGLGLILCQEFIKKHNGKISVESKPGNGSKFWFEIPIKPTNWDKK